MSSGDRSSKLVSKIGKLEELGAHGVDLNMEFKSYVNQSDRYKQISSKIDWKLMEYFMEDIAKIIETDFNKAKFFTFFAYGLYLLSYQREAVNNLFFGGLKKPNNAEVNKIRKKIRKTKKEMDYLDSNFGWIINGQWSKSYPPKEKMVSAETWKSFRDMLETLSTKLDKYHQVNHPGGHHRDHWEILACGSLHKLFKSTFFKNRKKICLPIRRFGRHAYAKNETENNEITPLNLTINCCYLVKLGDIRHDRVTANVKKYPKYSEPMKAVYSNLG